MSVRRVPDQTRASSRPLAGGRTCAEGSRSPVSAGLNARREGDMKRSLMSAGGLLLVGVVVAGSAAATARGERGDGARPGANARAIHVIEHAVGDTITHN